MAKIDYKKELKHLYKASGKNVSEVDVPGMNYLMMDGAGDPNGSESFQMAVNALFNMSFTMKFAIKKQEGVDYTVMPLEGLWWIPGLEEFQIDRKDNWKWTLMIMQPPPVDISWVEKTVTELKRKKDLPALDQLRFEAFREGKAAQILHVGLYSEEKPTIDKLHRFIHESGFSLHGKHHEIYLSDTRRAAPENWKTIIRQPFK